MNNILKTKYFLKSSFKAYPHYSFNDWRIMYRHSITVLKFAKKISKKITCNNRVLYIASLLHDIGKTVEADEKILREKHSELAYVVSKDFIDKNLRLVERDKQLLQTILSGQSDSIESKIIADADTIAFFTDQPLQTALKVWADKNNLPNELQRKLDKQSKLNFEVSKVLSRQYNQKFRKTWSL